MTTFDPANPVGLGVTSKSTYVFLFPDTNPYSPQSRPLFSDKRDVGISALIVTCRRFFHHQHHGSINLSLIQLIIHPQSAMVYRPNPFFATTNTFFAPSVGDQVDNAIAQAKGAARDVQNKSAELYGKADMKLQDAKEAVKVTVSSAPTGFDLYSRCVDTDDPLFCCC